MLADAGFVTSSQLDDKKVKAVAQLIMATKQIGMSGDASQVERAATIIDDARRSLYQLLAE